MSELFIEVRSEELPARFVPAAIQSLAAGLTGLLKGVSFGAVTTWATPRRLAVSIEGVALSRPVVEQLITGPAAAQGFVDGKPTKIAEGFARGKGVPVEAIEIVDGPKGKVIAARVQSGGESTAALVAAGLEAVILGVTFPKSMRWGSSRVRWARPLHGVIALLDGAVIPATVAGIPTGDRTLGHRLAPEPLVVTGSADWAAQLEAHFVLPSIEARRARILAQLDERAAAIGLQVEADAALVEQVTNLVEWPVVIEASFAEGLLELPPRLLVESMKVHQRLFPLYAGGTLSHRLLVVTNHPFAHDPEVAALIAAGNSRVLGARFYDARFFNAEDRKKHLVDHGAKLAQRQWIRDGGTMADKQLRVEQLARALAPVFGADPLATARAASLCKADLATQMVGEFPELQGHVGRLLALHGGETEGVALAIEEHYLPRFSGDALPTSPEGRALAVADRLDTLTGCFSRGLKPKGNADPLGLRRAAIGMLTLLLEAGVRIDLPTLLTAGGAAPDADLQDFVTTRLRALLIEAFATDQVDAVLATGDKDPLALRARALALQELARGADFSALKTTFKRMMNIAREHTSGEHDPSAMVEPAEQALLAAFHEVREGARASTLALDYGAALAKLATLRPAVDRLFTELMVMADDPAVRANRLGLLRSIADEFALIADFTRLSSEG